MTLLAVELSRVPRSSSQVMAITIAKAGRLTRIGSPSNVRRRAQQAVHVRVGTEQRRAIAGGQPCRQVDAHAAEERAEVVAPRDGDGHVADRVLEDQVPADDPGDHFAQRGVGIGVRAAGLRNHRRQLGVAQRRQRAHRAEQQERQHQRRPGAVADHHAVGPDLARRGRADGAEDAGADDGADRQHHQIAGAEHALQRMAAVARLDVGDRFSDEESWHRLWFHRAGEASAVASNR